MYPQTCPHEPAESSLTAPAASVIPHSHPEAFCDNCGGFNVSWFTPSPLWNRIVRQPDRADPMLCPRCFILLAEAAGIHEVWKVSPTSLHHQNAL